jgi:hypothetical protein
MTEPAPAPTAPWYEGKADAEILGYIENKGWKKDDPIEVAIQATKQARELQRHYGVPPEQLLKLPKDASDTAGWNEVNKRLGVPADPKEYDFTGLKYGDGTDLEQGFTDALRAALHEAGVRKDAARTIAEKMVKYSDGGEASSDAEIQATRAANLAELQKLWGPNAELNRLRAMEGARRVGLSKEAAELLEGQIGYVNVMEAMRKIGVGTTEDTFVDGNTGNASPATRNGAVARKAELMSDKAWVARYLGGDRKAIDEMQNLNMLITGEEAA